MKSIMKFTTLGSIGVVFGLAVSLAGCGGSQTAAGPGTGDSTAAGDSTSAAGGPGGAQANQFQQKFPGTAALVRGVMGLRSLIQSNKTPLTALQAGRLYTVLLPVGTLPTLPQDNAKKIAQDLDGNLTPDQQEAIGAIRKQRRAGRGKGGGYPGGGGGSRNAGNAPAGGGKGSPGGAPAGGGAPGQRAPWFNANMAPDTNVFKSGQPQKALTEVLEKLKALQAG